MMTTPDNVRGPFFDPTLRAADAGDARTVALAAAVLLAGDRLERRLWIDLGPNGRTENAALWQPMPPESAVAEAHELLRLAREAATTPEPEEADRG